MEEDWVKVFTTPQQYLAELFKGKLLEHEIKAVVLSTKDTAYGSFGEYQLYVNREHAVRALHLIKPEE